MRDSYNIVPVTMALLLHVVVFGSMLVAFDWSRNVQPVTPMMITATLITESAVIVPPEPIVREPEPEPQVVEPEPIVPDPDEQARIRAEEERRIEDARIEQERIAREQELERQRQAQLEADRRAAEERRLEEARREAELQRQRDIEEQRRQNQLEEERIMREAQQAELDAEAERLEAMNSTDMQQYQRALNQKLYRYWDMPGTTPHDLSCFVRITQLPTGEVLDVRVARCNADAIVIRSIEAGVRGASPLPLPSNPLLFEREIEVEFVRVD